MDGSADRLPALVALAIGGPAAPWEALGLDVENGRSVVGEVTLVFRGADPGIRAWRLRGGPAEPIDGLPCFDDDLAPGPAAGGSLDAVRIDHVVIGTPDVDRTIAAFEAAGIRLRRERGAGETGGPTRQAFFRVGEVIAEVVGPADGPSGEGPASFWGLVLTVADLDAASERLGDRLGRVKDAVQPGRRIATVRRKAGLGVPVALITPAA